MSKRDHGCGDRAASHALTLGYHLHVEVHKRVQARGRPCLGHAAHIPVAGRVPAVQQHGVHAKHALLLVAAHPVPALIAERTGHVGQPAQMQQAHGQAFADGARHGAHALFRLCRLERQHG